MRGWLMVEVLMLMVQAEDAAARSAHLRKPLGKRERQKCRVGGDPDRYVSIVCPGKRS